jgi:DNA polymerase V
VLSISSRSKKIFALVDCNNFFASCERVFRPDLWGKPIVVLSNNDGNIIARSNEAKALGVAMGEPYFKIEAFLKRNNVTVFSSNYTLYGDMSHRVMDIIQRIEPEVEVYSIDESFISIPTGKELDLTEHGRDIRAIVKRSTGIPVSIGYATTKTLAKIANRVAKKNPVHGGVFDMTVATDVDGILSKISVEDIWGIGSQNKKKLNRRGIYTALHLKNADDTWVRKELTVTGLRTVWELRGIPCIPLEEAPPSKKSIVTSKSFGHSVVSHDELREAVSTYMARAAEKLRSQHSIANSLQIFICTNRFKPDDPQYSGSLMVRMPEPTSSTPVLIKHALHCLKKIYRPAYEYKKAGVMLTEIVPETHRQRNLFVEEHHDTNLMEALDRINRKWGRNYVQYACSGFKKTWTFKRVQLSQAYTTRWDQLPVVKASFPA